MTIDFTPDELITMWEALQLIAYQSKASNDPEFRTAHMKIAQALRVRDKGDWRIKDTRLAASA